MRQELARLQGDARELTRQQDVLRFQVEEIDAAGISPGEDEDLAARRSVLANAGKLREAISSALAALNDEDRALDGSLAAAQPGLRSVTSPRRWLPAVTSAAASYAA